MSRRAPLSSGWRLGARDRAPLLSVVACSAPCRAGGAVAQAQQRVAAAAVPLHPRPARLRHLPGALARRGSRPRPASASRRETLTRDGVWRLRARPAPAGCAIEAWYDSLALIAREPRREPRARHRRPARRPLSAARSRRPGAIPADARPFVPDEVAEVAELGGRAGRPAAAAAARGARGGAAVDRRRGPGAQPAARTASADGRVIQRLALPSRDRGPTAPPSAATRPAIAARQVTVEEGQVDWDPERGPAAARTRHIVVETSVPAGGPLSAAAVAAGAGGELVRGPRVCEKGSGEAK